MPVALNNTNNFKDNTLKQITKNFCQKCKEYSVLSLEKIKIQWENELKATCLRMIALLPIKQYEEDFFKEIDILLTGIDNYDKSIKNTKIRFKPTVVQTSFSVSESIGTIGTKMRSLSLSETESNLFMKRAKAPQYLVIKCFELLTGSQKFKMFETVHLEAFWKCFRLLIKQTNFEDLNFELKNIFQKFGQYHQSWILEMIISELKSKDIEYINRMLKFASSVKLKVNLNARDFYTKIS